MYKVGDKFVIEIERVSPPVDRNREKDALYRVKGFNTLVFDDYGLDKLEKYENNVVTKTYEDGLNDAWKVLKHIQSGELSSKEIMDIWGMNDLTFVNCFAQKYKPQEALEILEAYEKSQQIQVGDVVFNAREDVKAIIMDDAIAVGAWQVYTENGCVELWKECEFKKTGKTVNIEHLLEQIRGNE